MHRSIYLLGAWFVAALAARAQFVTPVSYTESSIGGSGEFTYFDTTPPSKLTDGVFGVDNWAADLGHGPAAEWVGWSDGENPTLAFTFAGTATIDQVHIDFNRSDENDIFLPTNITVNGTDFTVAADAIPNDTRGSLSFNGPWTGNSIVVGLTAVDNTSTNFVFIDEMQFAGEVVPEPQAYAAAVGLVVLGAVAWRRRRNLLG